MMDRDQTDSMIASEDVFAKRVSHLMTRYAEPEISKIANLFVKGIDDVNIGLPQVIEELNNAAKVAYGYRNTAFLTDENWRVCYAMMLLAIYAGDTPVNKKTRNTSAEDEFFSKNNRSNANSKKVMSP